MEAADTDRKRYGKSIAVRGVIFDMDGLLIDSEPYWEQARMSYCRSVGCSWRREDELKVKGCNSPEWATVIRMHCELTFDPQTIINEVSDRMQSLYGDHLPLLPGAVRVVKELATSYPLGLASSSPRSLIEYVLREAGILACFAVLVSSDEVGKGKPSPDVFLVAAERMGISPEDIVVFEDSSSGIAAARDAGMSVVAVPNDHFPPDETLLAAANLVLSSLDDFTADTLILA